jgi:hypothetical protein
MSNESKILNDENECRYGNSDRWNRKLVENLPIATKKRTIKPWKKLKNGLSHSWELILTLTLQNAEHQRRNVVSFNKIDKRNDE